MPFAMTPNHHMLLTVTQLDIERRNQAIERRRPLWEVRRQAKQNARPSASWSLAAACRALAALVAGLARIDRRSPLPLPASAPANSDLKV